MILAGDIGGTKTNLALFEIVENLLVRRIQYQFHSRNFENFMDLIEEFRKNTQDVKINAVCFGIAGPVIEGKCKTTNLPWNVNEESLKKYFDIQNIKLINDLEATAYGMLYLKDEDFVMLNPKGIKKDATKAVIAAGTGLGEGMLFYDGVNYHPSGSEGGHCDFAPLTSQQDALLAWLRKRHPDHVSYEKILSGPGVYALYEFLYESGYASQPQTMLNLAVDEDKSAAISRCALEEKDLLCVETLRLFSVIYGAEAGNLALKTLSLGGVYIGGGIAPKILPFLNNNYFMKGFLAKGRFSQMLSNMEVKLSTNQETALLGAVHFAYDKL